MKTLIVLTGMMGAGKSTVGKLLAKRLGYDFVDIDCEIEKSENMTISNIFNEHGEHYFRKIEKEKVLELSNLKKTVLSLGGGAFEDEETRKILKKNSIVIYLKATPACLFERVKSEIHRPLLHKNFSVETIAFIMKKRAANYEKAQYTIDTCNNSPEEVVKKILGVLK